VTGPLPSAVAGLGHLANFDVSAFQRYLFSDLFFGPFVLVVAITLIAQTSGIILGFPLALGRISKNPLIHLPVDFYLYIFRGTPLLLQIAFIYDGLAELLNNPPGLYFITRNALVAGTLALILNEAAYMTEIIRSGLQAIDPGQYDAARALGMRPGHIARRIVIPQTIRIALPPTVNEYINMSKNTSLLGTISVFEIYATSQHVYLSTYKVFEALSVAAIWYLLITTILTMLQRQVEKRFGERQSGETQVPFGRRMLGRLGRFGPGPEH
jgi:polar amino acid transport system permease protein